MPAYILRELSEYVHYTNYGIWKREDIISMPDVPGIDDCARPWQTKRKVGKTFPEKQTYYVIIWGGFGTFRMLQVRYHFMLYFSFFSFENFNINEYLEYDHASINTEQNRTE